MPSRYANFVSIQCDGYLMLYSTSALCFWDTDNMRALKSVESNDVESDFWAAFLRRTYNTFGKSLVELYNTKLYPEQLIC